MYCLQFIYSRNADTGAKVELLLLSMVWHSHTSNFLGMVWHPHTTNFLDHYFFLVFSIFIIGWKGEVTPTAADMGLAECVLWQYLWFCLSWLSFSCLLRSLMSPLTPKRQYRRSSGSVYYSEVFVYLCGAFAISGMPEQPYFKDHADAG